ncbi:MAG: M23 family metallopeptidase [Maricaulaceae bacterium]
MKRAWLIGLLGLSSAGHAEVACRGEAIQGGFLICRAEPGTEVRVDDIAVTADDEGWFAAGINRDQTGELVIRAGEDERRFPIATREYDIQRIDGLPPSKVNPYSEADLAHIARDRPLKARGFSSRANGAWFVDGFQLPVTGARISGVYGSQRILNGEPRRPHYGIDYAAPTGTAVVAPAGGVVSLAGPDFFFEGGMVLIDHGQGVISAFLHLSEVDVTEGDRVAPGDRIGAVGSTGRSTGPHLHWQITWRGRRVDPGLALAVGSGDTG